jgi:uncharacterized membrane protein
MTGGTGWFGLLALVGLIGVGVFVIVTLGQRNETTRAVSILNARYVRGEITRDEYETIKAQLRE